MSLRLGWCLNNLIPLKGITEGCSTLLELVSCGVKCSEDGDDCRTLLFILKLQMYLLLALKDPSADCCSYFNSSIPSVQLLLPSSAEV